MSNNRRGKQSRRAKRLGQKARRKFEELLERQGNICANCGKPMRTDLVGTTIHDPDRATIEHKVPLGKGGDSSIENLELIHYRCNQSRNMTVQYGREVVWKPKRERVVIKYCRQCGQINYSKKSRNCPECKKAFLFLFAGVGTS